MSNIRKDIMNHLELSNRVKEAVTEFFKENKQKDAIVQKHFSSAEDYQILYKFFNAKINIIEEKIKYLEIKNKFKDAISRFSSKSPKISEIAKEYNISYQKLFQECRKFMLEGRRAYEYDDIVSYEDVFTFYEEKSLLNLMNNVRETSSCSCRYCALEYLLNLAYITAFTKNKTYPSTWNVHKQADKQWLYKFEMRYTQEISEYSFSCTKHFISASSSSQSPSFNVTILEPSTLSKHQIIEKIKLENDMQKIVKIYERFDIKQRITNFLNLSERLMSAAEEYLVQKNLENVVQRCEIQSDEERRILINILFILEENNKYHKEKNDCENAVFRLSYYDDSIENVAKNYNINPELLENEIKNYKVLNNIVKHTYEYDKIICTLECLNITYIEESLLLEKLYIWRKKSESLCSCQICALEHLYNLITDTITNYKGQKSHMSTDKIKKLNEEWFCEFVIRYKEKIFEFSSNCKKDETSEQFFLLLDKKEVSKASTSSADLQRNFVSLQIPNANMMAIRQQIIDYLNLNNRLEKAAEEVINKKSNEETVTQKYGFNSEDRRTLNKKIEIEKKKYQYFTSKNALDKTFNLIKTNKESNLIAIAEYSQDIFYKTVHDEYAKYNESKVTYKYDDYVSNHKVLTYNDEFSLLDKLDIWKTKSQSCTCQVCALENVYYLVYIFTNINKLEEIWKNEMIHGNWICEFVMRHSAKISEFSNYSACERKDKCLTSMSAPQLSPSKLGKEKSLESNIPNITSLQCADPQIYNARIQEKERFIKRTEIVDHLSESKWFQTAAEEVINNKEDVVTVARKYGFHSPKDREALDKRIDILKKKRKYFELKHKIEEAVKTILSDNITEVAEKYNIDNSILNEEFKKYSALENKDNYIYNPFTSDNEMLTYSQESMLLTLLQKWKNNPKRSCHCWFCALEYLCKQAYIIIKTKKPIQWNKHAQADVNWLYEFEMRYSKEIFEILPSCMKCSLESRSASEEETSKPLQKRSRMH